MRIITAFLIFFSPLIVNAVNLVNNPGFEELDSRGKLLAWNEVEPVYRIMDGAGRNGSRGLAFDNSDPAFYSFPSRRLSVKPGQQYDFSTKWMNAILLKNAGRMSVQWPARSSVLSLSCSQLIPSNL